MDFRFEIGGGHHHHHDHHDHFGHHHHDHFDHHHHHNHGFDIVSAAIFSPSITSVPTTYTTNQPVVLAPAVQYIQQPIIQQPVIQQTYPYAQPQQQMYRPPQQYPGQQYPPQQYPPQQYPPQQIQQQQYPPQQYQQPQPQYASVPIVSSNQGRIQQAVKPLQFLINNVRIPDQQNFGGSTFYNIHVYLVDESQSWIVSRRYSQFEQVKKVSESQSQQLSIRQFPPKFFFSLSESQTKQRAADLQGWLNDLIDAAKTNARLAEMINTFLEFSTFYRPDMKGPSAPAVNSSNSGMNTQSKPQPEAFVI